MSHLKKAENQQIQNFDEATENLWEGNYSFIFIADPQPGLIDMIENHGKGHIWKDEIKLISKSVEAINKMNPTPKFVCIGGDIINALPGEDENIRNQQVADVKEVFSKLKSNIPVFFVSGNHDVGNNPDSKSIYWYHQHFGDDFYSFWVGGVFYIVINSQLVYDRSSYEDYAKVQEEWFEEQLKKCLVAKHSVLFMHIPMFINKPDEQDFYFNIPKQIREDFLKKISTAGIKKVFCGHYHRNAGGFWTSTEDSSKKVECIVSSAVGAQLGDDASGIRIVKVDDNEISHQYYSIDKIPQKIFL